MLKTFYNKIKKLQWLRLSVLTIVSLTAGFHLLVFPDTVSRWIIRGVGLIWFLEGLTYLLDLVILLLKNKRIKQTFCRHNYVMPPEFDDEDERNKLVSELKEGESISFSRIHRCTKCGKEKMIGSGWFF